MKQSFLAIFMAVSATVCVPSFSMADIYYNYVPVYDTQANPDRYGLSETTKTELDMFMDYEHREPCQHYWEPPAGFAYDGCDIILVQETERMPVVQETVVRETETVQTAPVVQPVVIPQLADIHFAWDSAHLDTDATTLVYRAAEQIKYYNPQTVIIHGHADTSGTAAYNVGLSQRRADAVEKALALHGVNPATMQTRAWGESRPQVQTGDGVRHPENRRVEVELQNPHGGQ